MQRPSSQTENTPRRTRFAPAGMTGLLLAVLIVFTTGCPDRASSTDAPGPDRIEVALEDLGSDVITKDVAPDRLADVRDGGDVADVRDASDRFDAAADLLDAAVDGADVPDAPPGDATPGDAPFVAFDVTSADAGDAGADPMPPRLLGPLHALRVTSRRPTLRWELPASVTGARVELCRDRACTRPLGVIDAPGTSVRPPTELPPGVAFWRARALTTAGVGTRLSATWNFEVGHRSAPIDTTLGSIKDFNGDGYDDLVVSAPATPPGGVVHIFYGSPRGVATTPDLTLNPSPPLSAYFGERLATGDFNGDAYADLLVTSHTEADPVRLYLGSSTGLASMPSGTTGSLGAGSLGVGDFDGDGFSDFGLTTPIGALYVYRGSASGITQVLGPIVPRMHCGSVGDANGDGYADLSVGRYRATDYGTELFSGSATGLSLDRRISVYGLRETGGTGGFTTLGDVNGDHYSDWVISDSYSGNYWYLGAPGRTEYRPGGSFTTPLLPRGDAVPGWSIEGRGMGTPADFNGDGYPDITAGQLSADAALVYFGTSTGPSSDPSVILTGERLNGQGYGVAGAGDLDGDGFDDLAVGEWGLLNRMNRVLIFRGGVRLAESPSTILRGLVPSSQFGGTLASLFVSPRHNFASRRNLMENTSWLRSARNTRSSM